MSLLRPILLIALLCALLLASLDPAAAQGRDNGISFEARAGFDGYYKLPATVPVQVDVRNQGPSLEATIAVTVGDPGFGDALLYTAPVSLPSQSAKRVNLYVNLPEFGAEMTVRLLAEDQVVAETTADVLSRLDVDDLLYGVISPEPGALTFLSTIQGNRNRAAVALLSLADLPDIASGWQALDVLVLDDVDTSQLTMDQRDSLRVWVENGGQLIVTGGPGGMATAAGLESLLPVAVTGTQTLSDLPALASFAGDALTDEGPYIIANSTLEEGQLLIDEGGVPLLVRRSMGLGRVYFFALDPKLDPVRGWSGSAALWETMLRDIPANPPWRQGLRDGFTIESAIAAIPGLELPSIWLLAGFLLLYIFVIGPLNFVVLRRLRRPELAWVTTPALVIVFSLFTLFMGFRVRGSTATLNEMAVASGHIEATTLHTQTAAGLYSPQRAAYDLVLPYETIAFPFGTGFGVLQSEGNMEAIERTANLRLRGIRTDTSELATFLIDSYEPSPAVTATARLADENGSPTLTAQVTNAGPLTLENATLIIGETQVALGNLAPGESREIRQPLSTGSSPGAGSGGPFFNPIVADPSFLLGTPNYFVDESVFPRWQLIQALSGGLASDTTTLPDPRVAITLAGWINQTSVSVEVEEEELNRSGQTLYFLEIPVRQAQSE